jgi:long-chain acyl-CoA synthetase
VTAASLADLLFAPAERPEPDALAVVDAETDTTWAQLAERAEAIGVRLRDAGVETGMPVAVQLADSAMLVATIFGVWRAGGVYVPLNPRSTASERARVFDVVQPAVHITMDDGALRMDGVEGETARHDAGVALVQMTSGTTGRPKPVLLTHAGVLELMDGVLRKIRGGAKREAGAGRPMPNLIPVSLSLWAGIYNMLFAFRVGAAVVLLGAFEPQRFAELVERYQVKSTVLPPAAMTMLTNDDAIADLAPLRFVRSITAPLSPLEATRFHDKFGIAILNSYGQTEIGGEIIGWNAAESREFGASKLGALGRPHDGVHVRIDDPTGELQVRTPALSAGYADGADLGDRLTDDGWFRTGDIGRVDDDGFVWIEGRMSDMINRGGLKVFPAEVEEVLRLSPSIADVAVVGAPDDRVGEVPVAFVVLRGDGALDAAALDALAREQLAPYKVPMRFVQIDALPRNDVGKVLVRELLTRL